MTAKLTYLAARSAQPGEILRDEIVRGLELHAKPSGKSWFFYYRSKRGERRRPKLGEFPALGIEEARAAAREMATKVAAGNDPSAEWKAFREAPTLADVFALYAADLRAKKKPRWVEECERNWRLHVADKLGSVKAEAVSVSDVKPLLDSLARVRWKEVPLTRPTKDGPQTRSVQIGGPVAANRVRTLISGVLTFCERSDVAVRPRGSNFIGETAKRRERKRRRHVTRAEFPRIWKALQEHEEAHPLEVAAIWATLYSGARVSELLECRRAWLQGSTVIRPDHKTEGKTGDDRIIRLPRQALDLIARVGTKSPQLFGAVDRWDVGRVWDKVRTAAGCRDVQPRDLRRTFASVAATTGFSLDETAHLLGHAGDTRVTAGYAYVFDEDKHRMVQEIADTMDRLAEGK